MNYSVTCQISPAVTGVLDLNSLISVSVIQSNICVLLNVQ